MWMDVTNSKIIQQNKIYKSIMFGFNAKHLTWLESLLPEPKTFETNPGFK